MLLFNHATMTIIRHVPLDANRHGLDAGARGKWIPSPTETYETPVVARGAPLLLFNVLASEDFAEGASWSHVAGVDLTTGAVRRVLGRAGAELGADAFVGRLLAVSDDGSQLTVVVVSPAPSGHVTERALADVDLSSGRLTRLVAIP